MKTTPERLRQYANIEELRLTDKPYSERLLTDVILRNAADDLEFLSSEGALKDAALAAADYLSAEVEDNWEREGYLSVDTINAAKAFRKACLVLVSEELPANVDK